MDSRIRQAIEQCHRDSLGSAHGFGDAVATLAKAGVQSYFADYRAATTTFYGPDGDPLPLVLPAPAVDIADAFDAAALQAAIRGAQRGEVKYPEFLARSRAAGCVGYFVWLAGRHVTYLGRRGEQHLEKFPS